MTTSDNDSGGNCLAAEQYRDAERLARSDHSPVVCMASGCSLDARCMVEPASLARALN